MKILIVTQYYYPEQFQINEIAPELVKRRHEVTVLCGVPNYPEGIVFQGYESKESRERKEQEYFEKTGVRVVHVNQVPRVGNLLALVRNYLTFVRNSKRKVKEWVESGKERFDVVLGYQLSPITSMYAALEYKKLMGVPVVYYTLDVWPVSAEGMLKSKKNPLMWPINCMSRELYQGADRVLVTSRPFMDYLHCVNGIPMERMAYLPQHADLGMMEMDMQAEDNDVADFMFAGNIGKGQRADVIIEAAKILGKRNDYKIHMVGDGRMRNQLEKMVKEYGLQDNVVFYGNQRRNDMSKFYKMADVLLITLRGNNEVGNTIPGKLQMYMTTGKTIMGAINGGAQEVIKEAKCGSCVAAGDYQGLAKLMKFYLKHPTDFSACGENARKYFLEHFTLNHYMNVLEKELQNVIK
ncbi:glycosyltransferase family 4 protein [Bacteroides xylanisolvens]|uniref:glycosyltransferase family 4 protein n=1 Tax=Bacteroides xylanisolvens TaxID=371601 RepID=UPI001CDC507B|nr:glycosyltransferase family 4 protein [Bacteroides xylanisolvens]MCA4563339.1 glycosyltransferase family 4 protein [Bacteroides xylanisolvens]